MRLLLVEDSTRLRELLGENLRDADYPLDAVGTAAEARAAIAVVKYDLFVIDLGLPDDDGMTLIHELRSAGCKTPILVITARAGITDRIAGRSEEHTSELQSLRHLVCRLLLEKKKKT